jgi:long-chain acyl-CoA synthetase
MNPIGLASFNGRVGLPVPSTRVEIRDDNDCAVGIDSPGELCVKGPQITCGYWNRPDETTELFTRDGWLRTGDYAEINDEGFVTLLDRKKDMILVSGFNVYPNEVEGVADAHPGVTESAAIGIPDARSGEAVKLFVVREDNDLDREQLSAYMHENLTGYKCPREIEFTTSLPRSNVGKILRRKLKT